MTASIPEQFENVTVLAKANVYFDGKVVSHTVLLGGGRRKTIGLIYPGEYHFGTDAPERMEIVAGACRVKQAGRTEWQAFAAGESFRVPGKSSFDIAVAGGIAQYICSYE